LVLHLHLAQGVLVQHPDDTHETPRIWLRSSQVKIKHPDDQTRDPAFLVVDIVRSSHTRTPSRLSVETIINLAENGVPKTAFIKLIQEGLEAIVAPLVQWEGPDAMRDLWNAVARAGGVMSARRAREEAGLARVMGYSNRDAEDIEEDDEDGFQELEDVLQQRSSAWWGDQISGCPSGLEETVMYLLDAGFTPHNCAVLREKLEKIVKGCVNNFVRGYRIDVPMSCISTLVPGISPNLANFLF
jgi:RNA-dependent RNA polymerase